MIFFLKNNSGFHLIEILITLAIISILSVTAFPVYSQYIAKERRLEAVAILTNLAIALEEFHLENNSYLSATLKNLKISDNIANNSYQLIITSTTTNDYLITAKPLNRQAEIDQSCGSLTLNASGEKQISGTGRIDECW